jgi:protein gp37
MGGHQHLVKRGGSNGALSYYHTHWRDAAWQVIKETPHCIYQILTKRPERILNHLPEDWPYPNVWLGTSVGCDKTISKLDSLRKVPIHPEAVRFVSVEPLLEDVSQKINLDGIGWLITGGESGLGEEYLYNPAVKDNNETGRRTMKLDWARKLQRMCYRQGVKFYFKQLTGQRSGEGEDALGTEDTHEYPDPPKGLIWMPEPKLETLRVIQ